MTTIVTLKGFCLAKISVKTKTLDHQENFWLSGLIKGSQTGTSGVRVKLFSSGALSKGEVGCEQASWIEFNIHLSIQRQGLSHVSWPVS
jgi:hypothetical protein